MTALNPEAKQPETQVVTNENTNVSQPKHDANISQQKIENITENQENAEADKDPNWRAFREARKKDRAEKEAALRRAAEKEAEAAALKAAMEAAFSKSAPSPQAYQQYYGINQFDQSEESEEQKIERKVNEIIAKKEREFQQLEQEREAKEWPERLKRQIPDVWAVCSQENLDYLDYHYPELSRPLQRLNEGFDKWHDIYHAIKKLIPNHSTAKKEAVRADINSTKPRSISSSELTPPGQAPRETWQQSEQRRAENWARMQRVMKGIG